MEETVFKANRSVLAQQQAGRISDSSKGEPAFFACKRKQIDFILIYFLMCLTYSIMTVNNYGDRFFDKIIFVYVVL